MKSSIIIVLLVLIAAGLGYFLYDRHTEKVALREAAERAEAARNEVRAFEKRLRDAIVNQEAIPGMTGYQVKQSWGQPIQVINKYGVDDKWKALGAYEMWLYSERRGFLLMDVSSNVLFVKSYTEQAQLLDVIR